jgi:uncharacterized protein (TIGR02611 family)
MPIKRKMKRIGVGIVGGLVVIIGIILIPYPGPGWLVVFAGLTILATEFERARHVLDYAKDKYEAWEAWVRRQNTGMQFLIGLGTTTVVIVTLWLLNGYGILDDWFHLGWDWLHSPLPIFHR